MKIYIPNSAFLANIDIFIRGIDPSAPETLEITANPNWVSVHPVVLSMAAACGLRVKPENRHCEPLTARSAHYIVRMGLHKMLGLATDIKFTEHAPEGRLVPLSQIRTSEEASRFVTDMVPLLHLDNEPEQAETMVYIVGELVRNVLDHANSANGAVVCAQYFKKSNSIRIGIADTGIGIKASIAKAYLVKTDLEAIGLALTPGISGTTPMQYGTSENAGAGLFFIKSIAHVNRDYFVIYSGNGFYKLQKRAMNSHIRLYADPFKDKHRAVQSYPYWQGTAVGIDITIDQTQEFSLLLKHIQQAYSGLKGDATDQKKPRFI